MKTKKLTLTSAETLSYSYLGSVQPQKQTQRWPTLVKLTHTKHTHTQWQKQTREHNILQVLNLGRRRTTCWH